MPTTVLARVGQPIFKRKNRVEISKFRRGQITSVAFRYKKALIRFADVSSETPRSLYVKIASNFYFTPFLYNDCMIKHLIFDFGDVFLDLKGSYTSIAEDLAKVFNIPDEQAIEFWNEQYDGLMVGKDTPESFLMKMSAYCRNPH